MILLQAPPEEEADEFSFEFCFADLSGFFGLILGFGGGRGGVF